MNTPGDRGEALSGDEGWGFPGQSRKCHYFRGGESLCRKWGFYFGRVQPDSGETGPDDCVKCARLMEAERAAAVPSREEKKT